MKRRFAIPAAIALTAHALLFLGLGKPPKPPMSSTPPGVVIDPPPPVIEIINTPPASDDNDTACGGANIEPPKGIIERPPVFFPGEPDVITQRYVEFPPGEGNKPVSVPAFRGGGGDPNEFGKGPIGCSLLDKPPRTRFQKAPVYPFAMKNSETSGTVWVEFMVDETGRVHDVRVLKSTHSEFEEATCDAVSLWRFEPGKRKGIPVRFRMSLPVVFNLSD